jgi:hypothetical protein
MTDLAEISATDSHELFERASEIALIKEGDPARFAGLWAKWIANEIPDLKDLGKSIDEILKAKETSRRKAKAKGFATNRDGTITANHQGNCRLALSKMKVVFRHDVFADRLLIRRDEGPDETYDDPAMDALWLDIDDRFGFRPTRQFFQIFTENQARQNAFHPVRDYLNSLSWDGQERIDRWLITYGAAEDTEYVRAVGAIVLIAAVRRVFAPGAKIDEMLVLESGQGLFKSSALHALAKRPEWFSDDLPMTSDAKKVIEQTKGCWIMEAGELAGMRKAEVEHVKSFLSRQSDKARAAYGHLPEERPRHFIVIGTTNSDRYLSDSTGNRRFWPVKVGKFDINRLKTDVDQLWAEAVLRERRGDSIRLAQELWPVAGVEQEQRRQEDPWEEVLANAFSDLKGRIRSDDVFKLVGIFDHSRKSGLDGRRIGEAMRLIGYEKKRARIGEDNVQCWVHRDGGEQELVAEFEWEQFGESGPLRPVPGSGRVEVAGTREDDVPF